MNSTYPNSLYSLGIILLHRKMQEVLLRMVNDLFTAGGVAIVRLGLEDMQAVVHTAQRFGFDFDDAYQYVVAEKFDFTIVSFDSDFDRTDRGRQAPGELLQP